MSVIRKIKNKVIGFSNFIGNGCFLERYKYTYGEYNKKIYVYSMVWGDYLEYYFNYVLPSLYQQSNLPMLEQEGFEIIPIIYTLDEPDKIREKYSEQISKYLPDNLIIEKITTTETVVRNIANESVLKIFKRCIEENALFMMAPPDTIFGDGSIYNSVMSVYYKGACFASIPVRVRLDLLNDSTIDELKRAGTSIENSTMVRIALDNLHDNFKYADDRLDNNTTKSGVSIRKITDNLYSVISNTPTTWVVCPRQEDYQFFDKVKDFNQWDRGWLELLIKKNRVKVSGSSDQFFCVELTMDDESFKAARITGLKGNDYSGNGFQNRVCNMISTTWRCN